MGKLQRIKWVDLLRGLGIILVILGHINNCPDLLQRWIYSFHMPLFFFVGGIVYKKRGIREDIRRRFVSLMFPYFIYGMISQFYFGIIGVLGGEKGEAWNWSIYTNLLYGQYDKIAYNKVLWFLPCFFLLTVIYNILFHLIGYVCKKPHAVLLAVSVLLAIVSGSGLIQTPFSIWGITLVPRYLIYYACGVMFTHFSGYINGFTDMYNMEKLFVAGFSFSAHALLLYYSDSEGLINYVTAICAIIGCIAAALFIVGHLKVYVLNILGQRSLEIMCIHVIILSLWENSFEHVLGKSSPFWLSAVITIDCSVVIAALIYKARKEFLKRGRSPYE